jgi:hypothetical protein
MFISKKLSLIFAGFVAFAPSIVLCDIKQEEPSPEDYKAALCISSAAIGGNFITVGFSKYLEGKKLAKTYEDLTTPQELKKYAQSMKNRGNARIVLGTILAAPIVKLINDTRAKISEKDNQGTLCPSADDINNCPSLDLP